jgi:hypothetical protein
MRIRHSLKAIIPIILMLAGARTVQAQGGPPMQGMPMPGMPMPGGQQIPGSYGMYPYQSPYQGMFEQTYQRDGTWFQNSVNGFGPTNRPRDWFVNLDYTRTRNRKMSGLVGAEGVQTYLQQNDPNNDDMNEMSNFRYFDAVSASIIPQIATNGIRLSGGFWNPDGSGFLYSGGFQFQDTATFDARKQVLASRVLTGAAELAFQRNSLRNDLVYNLGGRTDRDIVENDILAPGVVFDSTDTVSYGFFGTTSQVLDRTLLNLYGIPTTSGNTPIVVTGETAPYDLDFVLKQTISTGGANAAWAFSPVYDNDNIKIHPIVGGRYFRIDETFRFDGASTLLSYIDNGDSDTPINAKTFLPDTGVVDTTTTTTTTGGQTYSAPIGGSDHLIVYSYINSQVVSNLSGPELGFQYELGRSKGIQVTGSTRVAAMFNNEKLKLRGDNIGNFTGIEVVPDPITGANIASRMYDTNTTQGASLNAFSDTASSTHLSPLFEQSLNATIPIFSHVPVLRNMWQLEDAKLSLGWTFLLIGQVADPNRSIVYDSSPITGEFLHYQIDRDTFTQNTFNVGINWNY